MDLEAVNDHDHIKILLKHSTFTSTLINRERAREVTKSAYESLSLIPFIKTILQVVAASRNFRVVFDFNRDSSQLIDPIVDRGNFYLSTTITACVKELLDPYVRHRGLGILAHELCHYAMVLTYDSYARPYYQHSSQVILNFDRILAICKNNSDKEELIKEVFDCVRNFQHAELIARVPQLIVVYNDQPDKLNECRENFKQLFDMFELKTAAEMERSLTMIENYTSKEMMKRNKLIQISTLFGVCAMIGLVVVLYLFKA
ncbi:uncharacterized protein [Chironomus tepperi]|uniref:uncharacterized protein n=1 Tax=Chironomus tepperi TaxID=113505 RepID=UPI00391F1CAC